MLLIIKILIKYPPEIIVGINSLYLALLNNPDITKVDWSKYIESYAGGMAM